MFTLVAWYESIDPAAALVNIAAVQDQHITTDGDDVRVPDELPGLLGECALTAAASFVRAELQSPSLRIIAQKDMEPLVNAVTFGAPPEAMFHPANLVPLQPGEGLEALLQSTPAAGAEAHYALAWLGDGPADPIQGDIYTVRATAAIQQVVGKWVNGNLTFSQTLPVGRYQVVGLRVRSTDAVAARLVFPGALWRPGVPVVNAAGDRDIQQMRYGRSGSWGEFDHLRPPTLDVLGGVAAAQVVILDVVKVA